MSATAPQNCSTVPASESEESVETLRCFECRRLWPRMSMRWGSRPAGPVWFPRTVRVLRCPDCLPS
jgi:hypothetical protein